MGDSTEAKLAGMQEQIKTLYSTTSRMETNMAKMAEAIARVANAEAEHSSVKEEVKMLRARTHEVTNLSQRVVALEASFKGLGAKVDTIQESMPMLRLASNLVFKGLMLLVAVSSAGGFVMDLMR